MSLALGLLAGCGGGSAAPKEAESAEVSSPAGGELPVEAEQRKAREANRRREAQSEADAAKRRAALLAAAAAEPAKARHGKGGKGPRKGSGRGSHARGGGVAKGSKGGHAQRTTGTSTASEEAARSQLQREEGAEARRLSEG